MTFTQGPVAVSDHEWLWRYVPLHTFFLHLQGKVFLPTIATLQECDRREGPRIFDDKIAKAEFTEEEWNQLKRWVSDQKLSPDERKLFERNPSSPDTDQIVNQHYYDTLHRSRFAWCWFRSEHESSAMWDSFGDKGVAIRTKLSRLQEALTSCNRPWRVSAMKYIDYRAGRTFLRSKDGQDWVRRPFFLKGLEYKHENEVRLVTVGGERSRGLELEGLSPEIWMEQILFWPHMPASCRNAVKAIVEELRPGLNGRLEESQLHSFGDSKNTVADFECFRNDFSDCFADNSMGSWPEILQKP